MQVNLDDLARYDTPTLCNAMELLEVRPRDAGHMNHTIRCCFEDLPPMVGYSRVVSVGEPVQVGGLTIRPGDLLHGDRNGVTVIPAGVAAKLPAVAAGILEAEKLLLRCVDDDTPPTVPAYRQAVARMQAALANARRRAIVEAG